MLYRIYYKSVILRGELNGDIERTRFYIYQKRRAISRLLV